MKSYTDLEQSKKLAEILPLESADMSINHSLFHNMTTVLTTPYKKLYEFFSGDTPDTTLPCWSLAALLEVLPTIDDGNRNPVVCKDIRLNKWHIVYHGTAVEPTIDSGVYDSLIDATVEMILKLKEKDLL